MKNFKKTTIITSNHKETREVLEKLESMGVMWISGEKATQGAKGLDSIRIYVHSDKTLTFSNVENIFHETYKEITAAEFLNKNECIVIYRKGSETIALDKTTGKKAVAKCHPDDEYNLHTGAEIALSRLAGKELPNVREVKRCTKAGEYIKIVNACCVPQKNGKPEYKNGDILKVLRIEDPKVGRVRYGDGKADLQRVVNIGEYVVLEGYKPPEVEEFKPYLTCYSSNYGIIGDKTPIKDVLDRELRVGDTVEIYYRGEFKNEVAIVKDNDKAFVMGLKGLYQSNGTIKGDWKIIKKRGYEDIEHGEKVDVILYVKER